MTTKLEGEGGKGLSGPTTKGGTFLRLPFGLPSRYKKKRLASTKQLEVDF